MTKFHVLNEILKNNNQKTNHFCSKWLIFKFFEQLADSPSEFSKNNKFHSKTLKIWDFWRKKEQTLNKSMKTHQFPYKLVDFQVLEQLALSRKNC